MNGQQVGSAERHAVCRPHTASRRLQAGWQANAHPAVLRRQHVRSRDHGVDTTTSIVRSNAVAVTVPEDIPFEVWRIRAEAHAKCHPGSGAANAQGRYQQC